MLHTIQTMLKDHKENKYKLKITHYANFLGQKEEKTSFCLSFTHSLSLSHTHTHIQNHS